MPRLILEEVYAAAGEMLEFCEGGRGLRLGDTKEAWKKLEEWRDSAGDATDTEDMASLDGWEYEDDEEDDM